MSIFQGRKIILLTGSLLLALFLFMHVISGQFAYETPLSEKPILPFVFIYVLAGIIYFYLVIKAKKSWLAEKSLILVLIFGILFRLSLLFSTPILEDDFYRYFWDGAVSLQGINPYQYSPLEISENSSAANQDILKMRELAGDSGLIFERINHSYIRTIYPPVTQLTFALVAFVKPWSMPGWRIFLLLTDLLIFFLLLKLLKLLKKPNEMVLIYWWNPLLIKEIFNSGHMDILIFPFLLAAFILLLKNKNLFSALSLGLAAGVKFWPVALLPLFVRFLKKRFSTQILFLLLTGLLFIVMILPQMLIGLDGSAPLQNYPQRWEANSASFKILLFASEGILKIIDIHPGHGQKMARIGILIILGILMLFLLLRKNKGGEDVVKNSFYFISALFLLSPTAFPWYFSWILIFLMYYPNRALLLFNLLLPVYYLRYYFLGLDSVNVFDFGIVWLEFIPVWVLLSYDFIKSRKDIFQINRYQIGKR